MTTKLKTATGKQLIKAINQALKSRALNNSKADCVIGAWGEDFPHLRFDLELESGVTASFDIEMAEGRFDTGRNYSSEGCYTRTRDMHYKQLLTIEYALNGHAPTTVKGDDIKDSVLVNKRLKELFNGMLIQDDEEGNSYCIFINKKPEK